MTIEERFENLESELRRANRRNRRLLGGLVVCAGIAVFAWVLGAQSLHAQDPMNATREVRAHRFVLEDENGKTRADLSLTKEVPRLKQTGLEFAKTPFEFARGKPVKPSITNEVPCLKLIDEKGRSGVVLVMSNDGPRLILVDEEGKSRVGLAMGIDGPRLMFCDEKEEPRFLTMLGEDGARLSVSDEKGKPRVVLALDRNGPSLDLSDVKGVARATLGVCETVSPDGKRETLPESSLLLFDQDGKVRWHAP